MEPGDVDNIAQAVTNAIAKLNADDKALKEQLTSETFECPECGAKVSAMTKYCPGCGIELEWEA